jgi:RES domain-containing protein
VIRVQLSDLTAYRVLDPRWSSSSLSGAGAAKHGGRVNRPGIETLYLALDHNIAILEYKQLSTLLRPGTLVSYQVSVAHVIDFREGYIPSSWEPMWQDFYPDRLLEKKDPLWGSW